MKEIREVQYPSYDGQLAPYLSWGAIVAGALFSFVVMTTLVMLGAGIGMISAPEADSARTLLRGLGIGGAIWVLLAGGASFYGGGWITGRLSGIAHRDFTMLHGVLSWSLAILVWFVFVTGVFGTTLGVVGQTLGIASAGDDRVAMERQVDDARGRLGTGRDDRQAPGDKDVAARPEKTAAKSAGGLAVFGFLAMLVEAIASAFGARAGTRLLRPKPVSEYREPSSREAVLS